jgi:hypothetical protein
MERLTPRPDLVAACGLYCGACRAYQRARCPGCRENSRATWCAVRTCCIDHDHATCAECTTHADPAACAKFHNLVSRVVGVVMNSDRRACIQQIRALGISGHAAFMAERRLQTLPRRGPVKPRR